MEPETKKMLKESGSISAVGLEMGISVAIGYFFGRWLDGKLGTQPYLMYLFLFFGLGAAFMAIYRVYKQAKTMANQEDTNKHGGAA